MFSIYMMSTTWGNTIETLGSIKEVDQLLLTIYENINLSS